MTPQELLDFLRSDRTGSIVDGSVWRDPEGGMYLITEVGREDHPQHEGYESLGTVAEVKDAARLNARYDPDGISGKLMVDLGRQIGRGRER